jgi:tetratricopeptide (TPR) repeat protein
MPPTGAAAQELRVLFTPSENGSFTVHLEGLPGHPIGVPTTFTPFLSENDFENLRWYLEDYMDLPYAGAVVRAEGVEKQIEQWGHRLHDAVFSAPENASVLKSLLDGAAPRGLTLATNQSDLLRLPWELIRDAAGSLAQRLSVRRQLETPEPFVARESNLPLRMLYIISRPADAGFIDPRSTTRSVLAALDPLQGALRLDFCRPPDLLRLEEMLGEAEAKGEQYDLVHFDGHGTFDEQDGALLFEKPNIGSGESRMDLVRADVIGDLLAKFRIPLVVLEACRSATIGNTVVSRSIAPRLIQAGIGSVLAMSYAVHVDATRLLLDRFYRELTRGATIGHAVAQARTALVLAPFRWMGEGPSDRKVSLQDWFLPHLYQRGLDERLISQDAVNQTAPHFDVFLSHNHNDSARVESLARILSEKWGMRVWLDKWERRPGKLEPQCEAGIRDSRFAVVVGSQKALNSKWIAWEIQKYRESTPEKNHLLAVMFESLQLPPEFDELSWLDFTAPAKDSVNAAILAQHIRSTDDEAARSLRGFRPPPKHGQPGAFPQSPQHGFHGRAREIYDLERHFRRNRGIVLHAMGGMGKTSLATEAAQWWTRSGLFRDGACFISFEQYSSADRVVTVLGEYCEGPKFYQRPATEQRRRAIEFFQHRAVLMVWDNYESALPQFNAVAAAHDTPYADEDRDDLAELFHDLTTGPGSGRVLVTCRPCETALPGALKFQLQGLARADSLWLLHSVLARHGVTLSDPRLSRDELEPLLRDLDDHPLSLELVGPRLRNQPPQQIRADFGELLETMKQSSDQVRNTSLIASLEFSLRNLSPAARAALPWLGLFCGGVFEDNFLDVSQIDPADWEPLCTELQAIALLRPEHDIHVANRPFLRFHPTLAFACADPTIAEQPETRKRYCDVYLGFRGALEIALASSRSRMALMMLDREEMNYRTAVRWATADGQRRTAAELGDTFREYLQRSGRVRERDAWVHMLHATMAQARFTEEAAVYEQRLAWTFLTQGDPHGAIEKLESLIERLRQTTDFDPEFQLATSLVMLGRVLNHRGEAAKAIPFLREAVSLWERRVESAGGQMWQPLLESSDRAKAGPQLGNLSAAMGDLSNALRNVGLFEEALQNSENCVVIGKARSDIRNIAAAHDRCGTILMAAGRYDQAAPHFQLALASAQLAGDKELEGATLQHQGGLAAYHSDLDRATDLYVLALRSFQEANNTVGIMQTYHLLGQVESSADRLAEALACYKNAHSLATELKDDRSLFGASENIGIVCKQQGELARKWGDEAAALRHFEEARKFMGETLKLTQRRDKPDEATAWSKLSEIHFLLGDLTAAEFHSHEARHIRESLNLEEVWMDYHSLSEIAEARGDTIEAAEWARKRGERFANAKHHTGGGTSITPKMVDAFANLSWACARTGFGGEPPHPYVDESLGKLDLYPAPYPALAVYLRRLASGELTPIPTGLPNELHEILVDIHKTIHEPGK